ncbi:MAG: pyrroline-5-carboxylate reductase [Candidatus Omnitrophica bacterium]|nr:pyrroline-5-carboxylate reductase [Candidatus Omnitrophota bacterium]
MSANLLRTPQRCGAWSQSWTKGKAMKKTIGIIGGGNMGEAIFLACRKRFSVHLAEKCLKRQKHLHQKHNVRIHDLDSLVKKSSILILAVKPQDFDEVLGSLKDLVKKHHLIVSIAAGITTKYIEKRLSKCPRVIRTMPNLPAVIGQGVTAVSQGAYASKNDLKVACGIFENLGKVLVVEEKLINAVTATSGSGPGYVYFLMEQMVEAARKAGLTEAMATHLVVETFLGSVNLLKAHGATPRELREKVTSKGGTTHAALEVFSKKKMGAIFHHAMKAAVKRAHQLSRR